VKSWDADVACPGAKPAAVQAVKTAPLPGVKVQATAPPTATAVRTPAVPGVHEATEATGAIEADGPEAGPVPATLRATTVNVYGVPSARLVTLHEVSAAALVVQVFPSGEEATAYPVIGDPPSNAGAVQETRARCVPAVAVTPVGESGTVRGVAESDGSEAALVPWAFVAVTVTV